MCMTLNKEAFVHKVWLVTFQNSNLLSVHITMLEVGGNSSRKKKKNQRTKKTNPPPKKNPKKERKEKVGLNTSNDTWILVNY